MVLWAVGLISTALFGLVAILQRQIGQEVAALQNARAMLVLVMVDGTHMVEYIMVVALQIMEEDLINLLVLYNQALLLLMLIEIIVVITILIIV